jgi:hypothetical protein
MIRVIVTLAVAGSLLPEAVNAIETADACRSVFVGLRERLSMAAQNFTGTDSTDTRYITCNHEVRGGMHGGGRESEGGVLVAVAGVVVRDGVTVPFVVFGGEFVV